MPLKAMKATIRATAPKMMRGSIQAAPFCNVGQVTRRTRALSEHCPPPVDCIGARIAASLARRLGGRAEDGVEISNPVGSEALLLCMRAWLRVAGKKDRAAFLKYLAQEAEDLTAKPPIFTETPEQRAEKAAAADWVTQRIPRLLRDRI